MYLANGPEGTILFNATVPNQCYVFQGETYPTSSNFSMFCIKICVHEKLALSRQESPKFDIYM